MIRRIAVVSALALAVVAAPAAAQLPFRLGVQAGASIPSGDFGDSESSNGFSAKNGYNVGLLAEVKPVLLPVGVRADVLYNEFGLEAEEFGDLDTDFRLLNVNANAVLEMPGIGLRPYVLGGLGWYRGNFNGNDDNDDVNTDAESAIGFNVGAWIKFGLAGFGAAVEAHYRSVNLDFEGNEYQVRFIPINFVLTC